MPADGPHISRSFHQERHRQPWALRVAVGGVMLFLLALVGIALLLMAGAALDVLSPVTETLTRLDPTQY